MPYQPVSVFLEKNHQILLPSKLSAALDGKEYTIETIGLSGSIVLSFEKSVLTIESHTEGIDIMVDVMRWMADRLPVPQILHYEVSNGKSYLLMSRISGKMTCDELVTARIS
jgi:aminoglycoside phosphotransferase